jgi:hypothetical protein
VTTNRLPTQAFKEKKTNKPLFSFISSLGPIRLQGDEAPKGGQFVLATQN